MLLVDWIFVEIDSESDEASEYHVNETSNKSNMI